VSNADVVYHLAAMYRSARHSDEVYRQVNVEGTRNVINAIRRYQTQRLIHCSTIGVHGDVQQVPADESADFRPDDIYQTTKLQGELLVQEALRDGLCGVVVRPSGIYGPGDRRFLKLFRMIKSRRFRMIGSGDVLFHLIYIDDLLDGFLRCANSETASGQTYILAGPRYVTLNELCRNVACATRVELSRANWPYRPVLMAARACEAICRGLAIEPPLHRRRVEFFVKNRAFDTGKAKRELGFAPATDLEVGLKRTTQWYQQHGWL
jgi:nucleoside-diphosphate-sugar epimerase